MQSLNKEEFNKLWDRYAYHISNLIRAKFNLLHTHVYISYRFGTLLFDKTKIEYLICHFEHKTFDYKMLSCNYSKIEVSKLISNEKSLQDNLIEFLIKEILVSCKDIGVDETQVLRYEDLRKITF